MFAVVANYSSPIENDRTSMASRLHFHLVLTILILFLYTSCADIRRECRKQSKVTWAALKRLKAGDMQQNDPKLSCYLKCFMMRHGIMDNNADVDVKRALRHMPRSFQDTSKKMFEKCKSVNGTDSCDKAYQMFKCSIGSHPEILQHIPLV